jgi:hypothetical protein
MADQVGTNAVQHVAAGELHQQTPQRQVLVHACEEFGESRLGLFAQHVLMPQFLGFPGDFASSWRGYGWRGDGGVPDREQLRANTPKIADSLRFFRAVEQARAGVCG